MAGSIALVSSAYFALAKITSSSASASTAPDDGLRIGGDEIGQHPQHAIDFVLFAHLQFAHLIVEFHRRERLDEQRRAAGRLIVHDALNAAFEVGLDRNDVTPAALRDDGLLQIRRIARRCLDAAQFFLHAAKDLAQAAAHFGQFRRGIVAHLAVVLVKAAANLVDQAGRFEQPLGVRGQAGELRFQSDQRAAQIARGDQRAAHRQQIGHGSRRAPRSAFSASGRTSCTPPKPRSLRVVSSERASRVSARRCCTTSANVEGSSACASSVLAENDGVAGQFRQDFRQFQRIPVMCF